MALARRLLVWLLVLCGSAWAADFPRVMVVHVPLDDPALVETLAGDGFVVDHVEPSGFEVYVRESEWARFAALKLPYAIVETQPGPPVYEPGAKALGVYHSYAALTAELQAYASAHPAICRLTTLGQSVQGRELWVLKITDNPDDEEDEPEFKYISTMHGDEPVGMEMLLYLIDRLLTDYGSDTRIADLVNETEIWIVPLMNPDGLTSNSRLNAQGLDLNRNFPTFDVDFVGSAFDGELLGTAGRPPEVARVMEWSVQHSFVHAANLHTGAVVVNYPYDYVPGIPNGQYAVAPDDALFIDVALRYSSHNPPMYASVTFPQGITNGCDWYSVTGGMQDWDYRYLGGSEMTIELSVPKQPAQSLLPTYWANNEESMLQYIEATHIGIRGVVEDAATGDPVYAAITVQGNSQRVYTDPDVGDYHRMALPGNYGIEITAPGYFPEVVGGIVVGTGAATRVDVALTPLSSLPIGRTALWVMGLAIGLVAIGWFGNRPRTKRLT